MPIDTVSCYLKIMRGDYSEGVPLSEKRCRRSRFKNVRGPTQL